MDGLFISAVTASELLHGVHRATPNRRTKREAYVESVIRDTPNLPFDLGSARRHAKLWASLAAIGFPVGAHEMLVAATCLRFGHRFATLNEGEFERVEGLKLVDVRPYVKKR